MSPDLLSRVSRFLSREVDPSDRAELESLLGKATGGDLEAERELAERFSGELRFGTAGVRGILGAGESRMNRSLVLRLTRALASYLLETVPGARERGVALARDGRRMSDIFQRDAASVLSREEIPVHWISGASPTPLLAFAVAHLNAACGVMITASHNPPRYNGYKVYWGNGAQIVPPVDEGISAAADRTPGASEIPLDSELASVRQVRGIEGAYLEAIASVSTGVPIDPDLRIAYSALHGCGQALFVQALRRRGFESFHPVPEQAEPHPDFPTVPFPNPEEPGALDLVLALARERDCDLVLVHDPDADRLGAAVRRAPGEYVVLDGNEIGVLLAHHLLSTTREPKPLVLSTVVSSRMVSRICASLGVRYEDTLTGFKWIANEAMRIEAEEGLRFVFGYEEALGYSVGRVVRDKDGIGAGLVLAEMAAAWRGRGASLLDALSELRRLHGLFATRQKSVTLEGAAGARRIQEAMARLRAHPPSRLAGEPVAAVRDLAAGNVLLYDLESGGRAAVRPSGTEPKLKLYLEVMEPFGGEARARAARRLEALEREMLSAAGLVGPEP